ncbi:MAG TPA: hypothetical protein VJ725_30870 [Thermoanaerobaculia bacterium]|nr:hypothetical protein [Thermoanaerobaculia bacterium]
MEERKIGQRYNVFFKGEKRPGVGVMPAPAIWTENGWQMEGYVSPEIVATIYRWELIEEPAPADRATS